MAALLEANRYYSREGTTQRLPMLVPSPATSGVIVSTTPVPANSPAAVTLMNLQTPTELGDLIALVLGGPVRAGSGHGSSLRRSENPRTCWLRLTRSDGSGRQPAMGRTRARTLVNQPLLSRGHSVADPVTVQYETVEFRPSWSPVRSQEGGTTTTIC